MMNKKIIGFAAVCGFVLSFLTGMIAKNPVLAILLRSLIFAAVFSVLSFSISFLFSKFLANDSKGVSLETDSSQNSPQSKQQKSGDNVNIVITDDGLEDDESSPKFFVENNRPGLSGKDSKNFQTEEKSLTEEKSSSETKNSVSGTKKEGESKKAEFISAGRENLGKANSDLQNSSENSILKKDVPSNAGDSENKINAFADGSSIENIDELPEIEDLSDDVKNNSSGDIINDSDFASSGGNGFAGAVFSGGTESVSQNADVMAQAVRTLLEKDK
ncbi:MULTISPECIES: hypothetical protein [unclassified Treponema]|uniref:hypothetical protein n=1 Tax=unclassified Treponema TaxID=2638727 RepID=UPI0025E1E7F1|nr:MULTISPECIES: hypothetical protein [unclassified Treponema]